MLAGPWPAESFTGGKLTPPSEPSAKVTFPDWPSLAAPLRHGCGGVPMALRMQSCYPFANGPLDSRVTSAPQFLTPKPTSTMCPPSASGRVHVSPGFHARNPERSSLFPSPSERWSEGSELSHWLGGIAKNLEMHTSPIRSDPPPCQFRGAV